jgi:hypothetical protein
MPKVINRYFYNLKLKYSERIVRVSKTQFDFLVDDATAQYEVRVFMIDDIVNREHVYTITVD